MPTDTERLDWLESTFGCALLEDDNGHWAFSGSGVQNVPEGHHPQDINTTFFVTADEWHNTAREAMDDAMRSGEKAPKKPKALKKGAASIADPCPFCGSKSIQTKIESWRASRYCLHGCGAQGPESDYGLSQSAAIRQATERWNARQPTSS